MVLLALLLCVACNNKTDVRITVNVTSASKTTLYLSEMEFQKSKIIDSVKIPEGNCSKKFRVKQGAEPTFYTIGIKGVGVITVLAQQGESIVLTCDTHNLLGYTVEGSESSKKVQRLAVEFARSKQRMVELSAELKQTTDATIRSSIQNEMQEVFDKQKDFSSKFIWENPMSKASVMAIYQKFDESLYVFGSSDDLLLIKTVASAMNALYPESGYAKGMVNDVKRIEKMIATAKLKTVIAESETSIPDLEIEDRNGRKISLSSLKGKVVLLDFWLTQNTNSLMENRELLNIYNQYKQKGFEIYQVALDSDRSKWLEALDTHKFPWINVCEGLQGSYAASVFNVQQIPANYLIDRDQRIIGKNLYGDKLAEKLKKTL